MGIRVSNVIFFFYNEAFDVSMNMSLLTIVGVLQGLHAGVF